MWKNNEVYYRLSVAVLKELLKSELITEDEFKAIDLENRRSFKFSTLTETT